MPIGRPRMKEKPIRVTLYLSETTKRKGERMAFSANQSFSQFVEILIERNKLTPTKIKL